MAETLQEFLVSVKYQVDAASQNNFLAALKRVAGSVAGVAGEIAGLAGAIVVLARNLSETGQQFYYMSQRLGSSIGDIQAVSTAMQMFGASAEEARGSIEAFGSWTRNMGPAATMYLRSMGVTATDTTGRMVELGRVLREMGGTADNQGTMQYSLALRRAALMGINEQTMLRITQPGFAQQQDEAGLLEQKVWGVRTTSELRQKQSQWARTANDVANQFTKMGLIFDTFRQKFALQLFDKVLPQLIKLNDLLVANKDTIDKWVTAAVTGMGLFLQTTTLVIDTLIKLPAAVQGVLVAFASWPLLKSLATSPLFLMITALTTLLLLMEDFQGYQQGKISLIDWGKFKGFTDALGGLNDMRKGMNDWLKDLTGVDHLFDAIALALGLMATHLKTIKGLGTLASMLLGGGRSAPAAATAGAAGGGLLGRVARWGGPIAAGIAAAFAIKEAESEENTELAKRLFKDDSATSLAHALIAKKMSGWAGISEEDWIKRNFPQWLDKNAVTTPEPTAPRKPINLGIGDFFAGIINRIVKGPEALQKAAASQQAAADYFTQLEHPALIPGQPGEPGQPAQKMSGVESENFGRDIGKGIVRAMQEIRGGAGLDLLKPANDPFGAGQGALAGGALAQAGDGGGIQSIGMGGPGSAPLVGEAQKGAVATLTNYFRSQGWSKEQTAGIIANLQAESGLNTQALGDSGQARGIAQWHPDRQRLFRLHMGKDVSEATLLEQAEFVQWELMHTHIRAGIALHHAMTARAAGEVFANKFEIPKDPWGLVAAKRGRMAEADLPYMPDYNGAAPVPASPLGATPPLGASAANNNYTNAPRATGPQMVQNNNTVINVPDGPTAHATAARIDDVKQYRDQQQMRMFSDTNR